MSSGDSQEPWWREDPERRELEVTHLRELGPITERERDGRLIVDLPLTLGEREIDVTVTFPNNYPYVPPVLAAEPGLLERHQNPNDGHFCVVDNEEHWWRPHYTATKLVDELNRLFDAAEAGTIGEGELDIPEPITGYLPIPDAATVVVFDPMLRTDLDQEAGEFELRAIEGDDARRAVFRIDGVTEEEATLPQGLADRLGIGQGGSRMEGIWEAVTPQPGPHDLEGLRDRGINLAASQVNADRERAKKGKVKPRSAWSALTFIEEGPKRGEQRRAWVFFRVDLDRYARAVDVRVLSTQALSASVMRERTRELNGLEGAQVTVVGAGSLGGHVVSELARAGVGRIEIVDYDQHDLNNSVRHVLPAAAAGLPKARALADAAQRTNPFVQLGAHALRVGAGPEAQRIVTDLVEASDVIVDTTGLHAVTRTLHSLTSAAGKPLVSAALSLGGFGGRIIVLRDASPCFDCFLDDPTIPLPEAGPAEGRTPYGCSHPAASCAGFDAAQLAAVTTRTAIQASKRTSYPELDFGWAVINFRPGSDPWCQGELEPLADCRWCGGNG